MEDHRLASGRGGPARGLGHRQALGEVKCAALVDALPIHGQEVRGRIEAAGTRPDAHQPGPRR
jgi:hypothetical protein